MEISVYLSVIDVWVKPSAIFFDKKGNITKIVIPDKGFMQAEGSRVIQEEDLANVAVTGAIKFNEHLIPGNESMLNRITERNLKIKK